MLQQSEKAEQDLHHGQVALPFNEEQFKDFIVSLLGKPQTITKTLSGSFDIDRDTIISLHEILNQRILQQNDAQIIQFRATIYYNDNSTVTLTDIEHLIHFNQSLPLVAVAVHLTWQYLVQFRDKKSPEKQEITISFHTSQVTKIEVSEEFYRPYRNSANFRIAHTARTWGADIEGLLTKHLKTIIEKDSAILDIFRYDDRTVENIVAILLLGITLVYNLVTTNRLPKTTDISFLVRHYGNLLFLFIGIFVLYKATVILLERFQVFSSPAFIRLTPYSEKHKIAELKSYKRRWLKYFGALFMSILLGILSNVLYSYFFVE